MRTAEFYDLKERVDRWAYHNAIDDYNYGSRQSYWREALNNGIITEQEYEIGRKFYGDDLWAFRGD